jgi:LuxR family maltose regulon positive regulatory protein
MESVPYRELLTAKFFFPPLPSSLLPRPLLIQRLNEAMARKLMLISAPAGYGKTTLLRTWAAQAARPVAWLSLSQAENDPATFWTYVMAACHTICPEIDPHILNQLRLPDAPPLEVFLTSFINLLVQVSQPFILVLDDYHLITEAVIHRTLRWLLDQQPPQFHLVLSSRVDPPLALAARRARGELAELRISALRFTVEEVTHWLTQVLHLPLSDPQITMLAERTEGWVAALRLAALTLQESANVAEHLAQFTGSHRYIIDYLLEEVLARQSEEVRTFLLSTACLDRFTGSLCDSLTGRNDGEAMLEAVERANLFLIPLDEQRHWYRYHHLFAEALRTRALRELGNEQRDHIYRQACAWYEQHGLLHEAIEAALAICDYDTAVRLGQTIAPALLLKGQHYTIDRWLARLPRAYMFAHPSLCLAQAWTQLLLGHQKAALEPLREAERLFTAREDRMGLAHVASIRALLARLQRDGSSAIRWGIQALELLPEEELAPRSVGLVALGCGYRLQGDVSQAWQTLVEARVLNEHVGSTRGIWACTLLLGEVLALQGQLTQAADSYQRVIEAEGNWSVLTIEAHIALGTILLEWNDLEGATAQTQQALALSQQHEDDVLLAQSALLQARILQAGGQNDLVEEAFLRAVILARQSKHPQLLARIQAYQARWWLARGNQSLVLRWQETCALIEGETPTYEQEETALTLIRILLTLGEAVAAERVLIGWQSFAHEQGRIASEIEWLALLALARDAQGHLSEALALCHQMLMLAQAGRYCRLFLDAGRPMARLLNLLYDQERGKAVATYLEQLLKVVNVEQASDAAQAPLAGAKEPLLEPLSPRERTVLRLLAAGLSSREMADELVVSINTIKTQLKSLYRKLQANSRQEALATARYWQLL